MYYILIEDRSGDAARRIPRSNSTTTNSRATSRLRFGESGNVIQMLRDEYAMEKTFSAVQPSRWPAIHSIGSPTRVPTSAAASDHQVMEPQPDDPAPDL